MIKEMLSKTTIANVVSGAVIVAATIYAFINGDTELLRNLAFVCAGWLFGVTVRGIK